MPIISDPEDGVSSKTKDRFSAPGPFQSRHRLTKEDAE